MLINNAAITMSSQHQFSQKRSTSLAMRFWVGNSQPPPLAAPNQSAERLQPPPLRPIVRDEVTISPQARKQGQQSEETCGCGNMKDAADMVSDPVTRMVVLLLEKVLGKKFKVFDVSAPSPKPADLPQGETAPQPNERFGWGFEMHVEESYYEAEQMAFAAQGSILTKDGQTIQFQLQLAMSREYFTQNSVHISLGDALTDPLVVNFEGTAAQLSSQQFQFDLNGDGENESIHFPTPASGFLALDKDGDGKISRGAELFGPTSGDGFRELAVHDDDGNGWIDSNDAIYEQLRILVQHQNQQKLYTLQEKNIGALYLNPIETPFTFKNQQNETLAQAVQSSIFVKENGEVGSLQRIDLAT
jgi:hypothetical protein